MIRITGAGLRSVTKVIPTKVIGKIPGMSVLLSGLLLFSLVFHLSASRAYAWDPEDVLKTYLNKNYPWSDVELNDVAVNGDLPAGKPVKIMVERGLPGRTVFSLEFENSGRVMVTANVRAYDRIVVSRRAFKKGYTLGQDDVYTMLMDVQRIPANSLNSPDLVIGKSLSRSITANTPLSSGMLQEGVLVKRGRRVTLMIEARGFTIATAGEMRENGSIGSTVKAINSSSKKVISGLLVDENTVKVEI